MRGVGETFVVFVVPMFLFFISVFFRDVAAVGSNVFARAAFVADTSRAVHTRYYKIVDRANGTFGIGGIGAVGDLDQGVGSGSSRGAPD